MNFVGVRLETVRGFYGLTLRALGDRVSASPGLLSLYETGQREPSDHMADALAEALCVRRGFFYEPLPDVWLEPECSFRHRRTTQEKVKRRARAHGTLIGLVIQHLSRLLRFPAYSVPSIRAASPLQIDDAATECRRHWKLGVDTPILQMGRVLENAGVVLVQHLEHSDKIDAFSRRGEPSVVVLNTARQSPSRWIYDLAHELGHFVLHDGIITGDRETEDQAEYFGGAFLLPRRAFMREFASARISSTRSFWAHVFSLKHRWRVSAQAIVRRAYQLDLISAITYRQAFKYASAQGWKGRTPEPGEPDFLGPELLPTAFRKLEQGLGLSIESVCSDLHLTPSTFYELTGISPKAAQATEPRSLRLLHSN
jgi:Zn-dependent peptidase ImmA (M78 family)/transcriptional regulator with XRE-family HTH domain